MRANRPIETNRTSRQSTGWRAWLGSIRNKILASFFGITLLIMISFGGVANYITRNQTLADVGQIQQNTADAQARAMADFLTRQVDTLTTLSSQLKGVTASANAAYTGDEAAIVSEIKSLDEQWIAADQADNDADPLVASRLSNGIAANLREYSQTFAENVEIFLTDRHGAIVAASNRTSDYNQADEGWWQTAYNEGRGNVYIGELEYDDSSKTFSSNIAVPVYGAGSREVIGVLRTTVTAQAMLDLFASSSQVSQVQGVDLLLPGGKILVAGQLEDASAEDQAALRAAARPYMEYEYAGTPSFVSVSAVSSEKGYIQDLGWLVVVHQHRQDALAPVNSQFQIIVIVGLVIAALATVFSFVFARNLSAPVVRLTNTAGKVASGDLTAEAQVDSGDEIGQLAAAFNSMTGQLRGLIGSLEQRVADRTKDLATVAEVGTATATILESERLLQEVVDLTKERFNLYHSHIYLLDAAGENLVLAAGAGEPGRQMMAKGLSIPLNREQSLVARAARERQGVIVNDVTQAPDFLPNPYLPDTRSELAAPMLVGGNLLGVFDIQSDQLGRFSESDANIQTTLAAQIATSVHNARLYAQAETSKQEAQSLVDYAIEGLLILDLETNLFTEPNESAAKLFGLAREELGKVGPLQVSPSRQPDGRDSAARLQELISHTLQTGTAIYEWTHLNAQRQEILCEVRLVRLPGARPRLRITITDITERKLNEELISRRAQQQEALNLITQEIQKTTSVESALQITARGLGRALGMRQTLIEIAPNAPGDEPNAGIQTTRPNFTRRNGEN